MGESKYSRGVVGELCERGYGPKDEESWLGGVTSLALAKTAPKRPRYPPFRLRYPT